MSPTRWILLLIFYISYLMLGASIYYHIEHNLETKQRATDLQERIDINEYLLEQLADKNTTQQNDVLTKISDYCGKPVTDYTQDEYDIPYTWTFYHSFFFAFTVCSTVGYGNISPTTPLGRWIMIIYSVIGIPVNGILFAGLGEYFGMTFEAIYRRYKKYKMSRDVHYVPPQLGLITVLAIALVPGVTLFLLLPSWVFTYFEDWPYSLSLYYSYVTTTTIGFGDYVPTFKPDQPREFGGWFVVYQIFVIVWFIFSLGYLLMIMTFITRGLQSKKLARLEQQLSTNIKATQNRIWSGVTKDVGYLRRILNELYILKMKPVYTEPDFSQLEQRSMSCPELTMYRSEPPPAYSRKRAFSECFEAERADGTPFQIMHASSDTELDKFDRQKSFADSEAFRQTTGLLAKVVSALATVKPVQEEPTDTDAADMFGGYHGFSDSQILASEWSFPGANEEPPRPRGRASSDFNLTPKWQMGRATAQANEWTWSGDNHQIQAAINNRQRKDNQDMYRNSFGQPPADYVVNMEEAEPRKSRVKKFSIPDGLRRLFKPRPSQDFSAGTDVANRKYSIVSVPETQQQKAPPLDYYSTVTASASPTYFQNGKKRSLPPLESAGSYPSDASISSKLSSAAAALNGGGYTNRGFDPDPSLTAANTTGPYQRNAAAATRKRRESLFTQNQQASGARRASAFPSSGAAGLTQRRGSLFTTATGAPMAPQSRRGSLFPAVSARLPGSHDRRGSVFSVASEEDMEVLENTTIADLIRALEVVHTQAVLDEANALPQPHTQTSGFGNLFKSDRKKRKTGTAGLDPPQLPPILSLLGGDSKALNATAANRLYARRATIVGTLPSAQGLPHQPPIITANISNRGRSSNVEPPPSYNGKEPSSSTPAAAPSAVAKFKRRFSVRPTALQIPPGQAPPPGTVLQQSTDASLAVPPTFTSNASQTVLQRRLSLRPSPLAREFNASAQPAGASDPNIAGAALGPLSPTGAASSSRLLALPPRPASISSSTHSPLSRIAQLSQAQRKISMPEEFPIDRSKKPDGK